MKHDVKILVVDPENETVDAQDHISAFLDEGFEIRSVSLTGSPTKNADGSTGLRMVLVMVKETHPVVPPSIRQAKATFK